MLEETQELYQFYCLVIDIFEDHIMTPTSQAHTSVSPSKLSKMQPPEAPHDLPTPQSPAGASKHRGHTGSSSYSRSTLQTYSPTMQIYF